MSATVSEDDLIARYFAPLAGAGGLGLRDDAALLVPPPGHDLVLTKDAVVGGVHFFPEDPPDSVARKALRVNLSDLAAKGADPLGFLLALALPHDLDAGWLPAFAGALGADARDYAIPLLGGDTVSTPGPVMVSVTAIGTVPTGTMVPRTGVHPGDLIYVSGTIGDATLGLHLRLDVTAGTSLDEAARQHLLTRYLEPLPRLALRNALRDFASGGMDVSDGLVGDLAKMLRVSGVGATIRLADVPLSAAAQAMAQDPALFDRALTGGDDYEILAAIPPRKAADFEAAASAAGVAVTAIGVAGASGTTVAFLDAVGSPRVFATGSFSHF